MTVMYEVAVPFFHPVSITGLSVNNLLDSGQMLRANSSWDA
jgi:hypothetical protein